MLEKLKYSMLLAAVVGLALMPTKSLALPIDWNGVFGVDYNYMDNYRKTTADGTSATDAGSQEVAPISGSRDTLKYSSMLFRLNPTILINDSASLKGEITHGYGRSGVMGDSSVNNAETNGNALFLYNTSDVDKNQLSLTKLYAELYSDTATYVVGRHSVDWGTGAILDSGSDTWDRHFFVRDGLTIKMKLGYFQIEPYYAIQSASGKTHGSSLTDLGFSILYDNPERDMVFGLLYSKRGGDSGQSTELEAGQPAVELRETKYSLVDIYIKKMFGNFKFELEIPWISGEIGTLYNNQSASKYEATSFIFKSNYEFNSNWSAGIDAGFVTGDKGDKSKFQATYLNPNFKIAKILFNGNMDFSGNNNIYDDYVTNVQYARIHGNYTTGKWSIDAAAIYAQAVETAKSGKESFNHQKHKLFASNANQSSDYGMEGDIDVKYQWNNEVEVGGSLAYLRTGDYFAFSNNASSENSVDDVMAIQVRTAISF